MCTKIALFSVTDIEYYNVTNSNKSPIWMFDGLSSSIISSSQFRSFANTLLRSNSKVCNFLLVDKFEFFK